MQLKPRTAGWAALMVTGLFLAGALGFWAFDFNQRRALASSQTSQRAIAAGYALTRQIHSVFADLAWLSQQQRLPDRQLASGADRAVIESVWQLYLEQHPYLDQIRYLDSRGLELIRVHRRDGEIVAVPPAQLQDKSGRYYVRDAAQLSPGQIYLSPLDLNVENGVIERPLKPVMRFILRLAPSAAGEGAGMLVLNVDADYLLHPLIESAHSGQALLLADAGGRLLLDESGLPYWRKGQDVPTAQLSASLLERLPQQDLYTQVQGNTFSTRLRVVPRNTALNMPSATAPVYAPYMPWFLIARADVPLLPKPQSLLQLLWSALLMVALLSLCVLLVRRSLQLERSLRKTDEYRQEAQSRADENAAMVAQIGEGILLFDEEQRLVRANDSARRMLKVRSSLDSDRSSVHLLLPELCRFGHLQSGASELLLETEPPRLLHAHASHLMLGSRLHHLVVLSEYGPLSSRDGQLVQLAQVLDASDEMILLLKGDARVAFINRTARSALACEGDEGGVLLSSLGLQLDEDIEELMRRLGHDGALIEGSGERQAGAHSQVVRYQLSRISHCGGQMHYLLQVRDVSRQADSNGELQRLGERDLLRVLSSRVQLARDFEDWMRRHSSLALLVLDIDRLRMINNSLGYRAGDSAIRQFSRRLADAAPGALVARLSADSFVLVCEGDETRVFDLIENVRQAMSVPMVLGGKQIKVSFSVGVAYWPEHAPQFEALLQAAQVALNTGRGMRGQVAVFEPGLAQDSRELLALEEYLKQAIEEERFELYFQPLVDAERGRIEQFEALMRLRDEDGQPIPPDRFIPVLEESGWILMLEPWLLRTAIAAASTLARRMDGGTCVAINVCGRELIEPGFVERLVSMLAEYRCEPGWISLEVTERQFLEHPDAIIEVLNALRELGVRVAVDDFGTGYSSLAYIKRLPVEYLKIDREFIRELPASESDQAIVRSVGRMAEGLGMRVIAEGVETVEQMDWLLEHRITLYQGYLFARPAPLETWLSDDALAQVLKPMRAEVVQQWGS